MNDIPAGARILLYLIYRTETGRAPLACYTTIIGHHEDTLKKPIIAMTIAELLTAQKGWGRKWGSSAAGAPQIIRKTMVSLIKRMGLSGNELFMPAMQDRMAFELLLGRGWAEFAAGRKSIKDFGNALAREWASFPVLTAQQGAHGKLKRGQSYYDGDGMNSALISPARVEAALREALKSAQKPASAQKPVPTTNAPSEPANGAPAPRPESNSNNPVIIEKPVLADPGEMETPPAKSKTVWTWALAGLGAIVTAIGNVLGGLDWRVQMFISVMIVAFAIYGIKRRADLFKAVKALKTELE